VRIALAGLGSAATRGHLPALAALQTEGHIVVVCGADPSVDRRRSVALQYPSILLFPNAETMLDACAVDLFVVASKPESHASLMLLAARRGLHTLCEKPLTVTGADHWRIDRVFRSTATALVLVQQYKYAPMWCRVAGYARVAAQLRLPFLLTIEIDREGGDVHASSPWREHLARSGGLLGDHVVHFIGLARQIASDVEPLEAFRAGHDDRETVSARLRVGSGTMALRASAASSARRTEVQFKVGPLILTWRDDAAVISAGKHLRRRLCTDAISSRDYVDSLYLPFYESVLIGLRDDAWRRERLLEALDVDRVLVALIEMSFAHHEMRT